MDVNAIASLATEMSQMKTAQAAQIAVLKKAMDLQGQSALQLVQAVTQPAASNPPNLGKHIDILA